jgi:glycosyltransferase involved in cell wall biosynthesis
MISIITPVYNGEKFIESCLQVVIDQKCLEVEHIIVDGGSSDKTVDIIKDKANQYSHIQWISEKDRGQSDALNKGIAMAQGQIIGVLNVDDFYEINLLNRVCEIFQTLPEPSLIIGNCNVCHLDGKLIFINKAKPLRVIDLLLERRINDDGIIDASFPLNPSAYFYHKSLHQQIGLYKVEEHYAMDVDFLLRAVCSSHVKYFNETWGNYRYYPGTKTFDDSARGTSLVRIRHLFNDYIKTLPLMERSQIWLARNMNFSLLKIFYFSKHPERLPESIRQRLTKYSRT